MGTPPRVCNHLHILHCTLSLLVSCAFRRKWILQMVLVHHALPLHPGWHHFTCDLLMDVVAWMYSGANAPRVPLRAFASITSSLSLPSSLLLIHSHGFVRLIVSSGLWSRTIYFLLPNQFPLTAPFSVPAANAPLATPSYDLEHSYVW